MRTLILRSALAHRGRLVLTVVAVALSVSFVTAGFVLADTLRSAFGDVSDNIYGGVDAEIRAGVGDFDRLFTGDRFPERLLDDAIEVPGVVEIAPVLGARNEIFTIDANGDALRPAGPPTLSFSTMGTSPASPFTIVSGRPPEDGEIMLDTAQAEALGVSIGETVRVATAAGPESFTLSGTVVFGVDESGISPYFLLFDRSTMQRLVDAPGLVDRASVIIDPAAIDAGGGASPVIDQIEATLPDGLTIVDQARLIDEQNAEFGEVIGLIRTALLGFAGLTMFVSTFVIGNTFAVLVSQQRRQVGLLRAIGATGRQATGVIVAEALVVGLVASAVGLGGGLLVAEGIKALVAAVTSGGFPAGATRFLPRTVVVGLGLGIGVTGLSALVPALRASRISPLEAMAASETPIEPTSRGFRALRRLASASVGWMGSPGRLAAASVSRNPKRVLTTAMSMIVGLAVIAAMTVLASSYRATLGELAGAAYDADVIVTGSDGVTVPFAAIDAVAGLESVEAASGFGDAEVRSDGDIISVAGFQSSTADGVVVLDQVAGRSDGLTVDEVVVTDDHAGAIGADLGSTIAIEFSDGASLDLEVVGIVESSGVLSADVLIDQELVADHARNVDADFGAIRFVDGVDPVEGLDRLQRALAGFPQLSVATLEAHVADQEARAQQLLTIANGLLGLTIVVALTGIANTVALGMLERRREIGLLRAVGMSRHQLRRMVEREALVLSLVGTGAGLAIGVTVAIVAVPFIPDTLIDRLRVPVVSLAVYGVVSVTFGVLAAVLPARRAARLDILEAITPR